MYVDNDMPPVMGSAQPPEFPYAATPTPSSSTGAGTQPNPATEFPSQQTTAAPPPGRPAPVYPPGALPATDAPVPWLAAVLGLIPGVGAMYNGQFAKGIAHLAIFALLVSLTDNVNGIFGLFVAGWVFYQSFEAYHTARARRDGLPLPNAFGLNDIGERLGLNIVGTGFSSAPPVAQRGQSGAGTRDGAVPFSPTVRPAAAEPAASSMAPDAPAQAHPYVTPASAANWAGYIPPSAFVGNTPNYPPAQPGGTYPSAAEANSPAWNSVPYAATYRGAAPAAVPSGGTPLFTPQSAGSRFPLGAIVLIVLGGIFLLSNLAPAWRFSQRWVVPLVLATASVWMFIRRVSPGPAGGGPMRRNYFVCALRMPVLLMVLAAMFALQALNLLTIGQTWPLLLIALGLLILLERTVGRFSPATPAASANAPLDVTGNASDTAEESER